MAGMKFGGRIRLGFIAVAVLGGSIAFTFLSDQSSHTNLRAQNEMAAGDGSLNPDCPYFTNFQRFSAQGPEIYQRIGLPDAGTARTMSAAPRGKFAAKDASTTPAPDSSQNLSLIDSYIFSALANNNIAPAGPSSDTEFLRRVTLDLTGRIPTADDVVSFFNDQTPDKRARMIDSLIQSPGWLDRWTMWFGDLLRNTVQSTQVTRYASGRDAFNQYIRDSLSQNKPYDQFASELISDAGDSFQNGEVNFTVGGTVTMGPAQDIYDGQFVQVATVFLGLKHFDCLLCHNGAGHLTGINLWGSQIIRSQAWGMAAYFSRTRMTRPDPTPGSSWVVQDAATGGYTLNTTSGNRPNRVPVPGQSATVTPTYLFDGDHPGNTENYRKALAWEVTHDFQFARAAVNYIWTHFFTVGIVDPPDAFDPARLDASNPPPAPWSLQPSNPQLLDALATSFVAHNYDIQWLMREITNSQAYQLSSRYDGTWNPAYSRLYARRLLRRLDSEEIHDALVQSSGVPDNIRLVANGDMIPWAMELPDTVTPGGAVGLFLNTFLRGDRDQNPRRGDLSSQQPLVMMNDQLVIQRVRASTKDGLLQRLIAAKLGDQDLIQALYLNVLSRYPTGDEVAATLPLLRTGNRQNQAEDILWSLYNKVDFLFNY